jgi:hypothetical protein
MDLPDNVTMGPYGSMNNGMSRQSSDRGIDMESTTYRQMNPHQNPYIQGQQRMDSMPHPEYGRQVTMSNSSLPPSMPPSYDFDQGPLGNAPQFALPPKDIPLDMSGFRDESAKPNYIPPSKHKDDYVLDQEERIRETKTSEEIRKTINHKFDLIAELQKHDITIYIYIALIKKFNIVTAEDKKSLIVFETSSEKHPRAEPTLSLMGISPASPSTVAGITALLVSSFLPLPKSHTQRTPALAGVVKDTLSCAQPLVEN